MAVTHDWECMAHGHFEARGDSKKPPRCPKGCSSGFVKLVHLQPPHTVSARTRRGDKLLRQAADMQGLSDISTSPSRPGGTVAERNRMRNRPTGVRGPKGREYPAERAAMAGGDFANFMGLLGKQDEGLKRLGFDSPEYQANQMRRLGLGHSYDANEWKKDDKSKQVRHVGAPGPIQNIPLGGSGVEIERVKEKT